MSQRDRIPDETNDDVQAHGGWGWEVSPTAGGGAPQSRQPDADPDEQDGERPAR